MKPFGGVDQGRIEAAGPPLTLRANAVQHLGLAFHELATNASKHGALSCADGRVSILWGLTREARTIRVCWRESGGPTVLPPERRGFGHVVIEQIVPRALNGSGALDFSPEGANWTFEFPVEESNGLLNPEPFDG